MLIFMLMPYFLSLYFFQICVHFLGWEDFYKDNELQILLSSIQGELQVYAQN